MGGGGRRVALGVLCRIGSSEMFQPPKQRLTSAKKLKLLQQLLPDLERKTITHKGRDWPAPLDAWAQAFDQMLERRAAGTLELPMKSHGYLYAVPDGMGIEFDKNSYLWDEENPISSRYVMCGHDTRVAARLLAENWQQVVSTEDLVIYKRP